MAKKKVLPYLKRNSEFILIVCKTRARTTYIAF